MAQPTIIGQGTNTKAYQATGTTGSTRTFEDINIPASANTVIFMFGLDTEEDVQTISSVTFPKGTELFEVDVSSGDRVRPTRLAVYDFSAEGASTDGDFVATLGGSVTTASILSVFCTDGYVQNLVSGDQQTSASAGGQTVAYNLNAANTIMLYTAIRDVDIAGFSFTAGTEIFKTEATGAGINAVAAKETSTGSQKLISWSNTSNADDITAATITISSQPNPVADINPTGDIISHDIITN